MNEERSSGEGYLVVARRYRPKSFEELVGQAHVAQALGNAIRGDRVGHAYLFTGARGVGKTSTARIFAKALNCVHGPTTTPCNECEICTSIATGEDMDVLEIDGASNRGIDEIRQLRSNVGVRPGRARYKIYIIDEVHMLTKEAFNALLKTLEEPPGHVKFIFATTDPEKLPITVRSRCQRFDFAPVQTHAIAERLAEICRSERLEASPEALQALARRAAGSMRDSQSLLEQLFAYCDEQITIEDVYRLLGTARGGTLLKLIGVLRQGDAAAALATVQQAILEGVEAGQLAEQLLGIYRDLCVLAVGGSRELLAYLAFDEFDEAERIAREAGLDNLAAAMQIVDDAATRMRLTTYPRIQLELALLRVCRLPDLTSLSETIARLEKKTTGRGSEAVDRAPPTPRPPLPAPVSRAASGDPASAQSGKPRPEPTRREDRAESPAPAAPRPNVTGPAAKIATVEEPRKNSPNDELAAEAAAAEPSIACTPAAAGLSPRDVDDAKARELWLAMVESMGDSTAESAGDFTGLSWRPPSRLVVKLRGSYNYERCLRKSTQLEEAFAAVAGFRAQLSLECDDSAPALVPASPVRSRKEREQEFRKRPMIAEALTVFEGEIVSIDDPTNREG